MTENRLKTKKYFTIKYYFIILVLMFIPILFLSNSMILNNEYLFKFANMFDNILKNINRASEIGSTNEFNYKIKFQYVYSLFIMIPVSIYMIYDFTKVYLCSMGKIRNCKKDYIVQSIQNNGVNNKFNRIFREIIFCLILFEVCYFGYIEFLYTDDFFETIFTSYVFCFVGTYLGISFSYVFVEMCAHFYKLKKRIFLE